MVFGESRHTYLQIVAVWVNLERSNAFLKEEVHLWQLKLTVETATDTAAAQMSGRGSVTWWFLHSHTRTRTFVLPIQSWSLFKIPPNLSQIYTLLVLSSETSSPFLQFLSGIYMNKSNHHCCSLLSLFLPSLYSSFCRGMFPGDMYHILQIVFSRITKEFFFPWDDEIWYTMIMPCMFGCKASFSTSLYARSHQRSNDAIQIEEELIGGGW